LKKLYSTVLFVLVFSAVCITNGQTIDMPSLGVPYACASPAYNSYTASTSYSGPGFESDNEFILEMSDKDGSFDTPYQISVVNNQNYRSAWAFDFIDFAFPENIGGDNFKLRVRSTSPAKVSAPSNAFSYYYYDGSSVVLNDYNSVSICSGNPVTVNVEPSSFAKYNWYKDAVLIEGENESSLSITEPGIYFAEVDLGPCNLNIVESISNSIIVTETADREIQIDGPSEVQICPGETYTFTTVGVLDTDMVQWFKDGQPVTTVGNFKTYTTPTEDAVGDYTVKIISGSNSCTSPSTPVSINYSESFTVDISTSDYQLLIPGETVAVSITTTAVNPIVQWYRNGTKIPGATALEHTTTQEGLYTAVVEDPNSCSTSKTSKVITIVKPDNYELKIAPADSYVACEFTTTLIQLKEVIAIGPDGTRVSINFNSIPVNFSWSKDGALLDESDTSINVSLPNNGIYLIQALINGVLYSSNSFTTELTNIDATLTASDTFLCAGDSIIIEVPLSADWTYQWFRNNVPLVDALSPIYEVTEEGLYYCEVSDENCIVTSNQVEIFKVNPADLIITPGTDLNLMNGDSQTITASGAQSYLWTDQNGIELSTTNELIVNTEGTYNLTYTIGDCEFNQTIEVSQTSDGVIPNVITANGDSINELWELPSAYRSNNVRIIIFNSSGKTVLNTSNYQNNWPDSNVNMDKGNPLYYYQIERDQKVIKKGTITVLK